MITLNSWSSLFLAKNTVWNFLLPHWNIRFSPNSCHFRLIFSKRRSKPNEIAAKTLIKHIFAVRDKIVIFPNPIWRSLPNLGPLFSPLSTFVNICPDFSEICQFSWPFHSTSRRPETWPPNRPFSPRIGVETGCISRSVGGPSHPPHFWTRAPKQAAI